MKTYQVAVLGCRTNQYEAQAYADQLQAMGYQEGEDADVVIVNTCTVTDSADKRSFSRIRRLAKDNPRATLVVTGCMAERRAEEIQKIPGVYRVVPNAKKEELLTDLFPEEDVPEFSIKNFDAHTRAFVKIQDGCNSYCSYCIIPLVRGRSRSRPVDEILREIHDLVANGYKEIVLTGINVGDFTPSLSGLVRQVDGIEGVERIRISSIDPDEVDEDLLGAVVEGKHTCHSMHLVLQSGSNFLLKRMRRKYTRQDFLDAVARCRAADPDFSFTTDVIVGFPGESEQDFQDTLDLIDVVGFAKVHMFPYSVRPKTRAARFTDFVPKEIIDERRNELLRRSEQVAYKLRDRFVGRTLPVLIEGDNAGHTDHFVPVHFDQPIRPNTLIQAVMQKNTPEGLYATPY